MRELVTAFLALESVADPERRARWAAGLSAVEPEKIYRRVSPDGSGLAALGNWTIYAAGGEAMREAAGLRPAREFLWGRAFFDRYAGAQLGCFSENGMYRDPGDPITYDVTTRLQIACALCFGYDGPHRAAFSEILRRGGLATLLFVSPQGFCPYGGRSAAFNFREAIVAALCEVEARRYRTCDPRLAGAFKRQARLSALAVRRWLSDMRPWRHIKNGFDPATRHGCDSYGNYSTYGLLAASFLCLAAVLADDTIAEAPCPAETGGFALELAPAFHKIFANVADAYLEIDTAADPHYDATGLGCFAVKGVPLELGPGMPFPARREKHGAPAIAMAPGCEPPPAPLAAGPAWLARGEWTSLAGLSDGLASHVRVIRETDRIVQFAVTYVFRNAEIVEEYRLARGSVAIRTRVNAGGAAAERVRFTVPLLVSDGASTSRIGPPGKDRVQVSYLGHALEVRFDRDARASLDGAACANRNGLYRPLVIEKAGGRIAVELRLS
jgi:hypothetical protein